MEEAERNLRVIRDTSRAFGLEINLRKSKAMIYKKRKYGVRGFFGKSG